MRATIRTEQRPHNVLHTCGPYAAYVLTYVHAQAMACASAQQANRTYDRTYVRPYARTPAPSDTQLQALSRSRIIRQAIRLVIYNARQGANARGLTVSTTPPAGLATCGARGPTGDCTVICRLTRHSTKPPACPRFVTALAVLRDLDRGQRLDPAVTFILEVLPSKSTAPRGP